MSNYSDPITATGSLITFDAPAGGIFDSLSVPITPTQDLHGYANPWPAGGGANKLPNLRNVAEKRVTLGQTEGYSTLMIPLTAGTYTIAITHTLTNSCYMYERHNGTNTSIGTTTAGGGTDSFTFTVDSDTNYSFSVYRSAGVDSDAITQFWLVSGSSAGTYTPYENTCPISGLTGLSVYRTGKNLLNTDLVGEINSTATNVRQGIYWTIPGTYTVSASGSGIVCRKKSADGTYGTANYLPATFTETITDGEAIIIFNPTNGASKDTTVALMESTKVMLEAGSSVSTYEPYNGNTYSVDWSTQAGTVYHGTVDPVAGQLTVDRVSVNLTPTAKNTDANGYFWYTTATSMGIGAISGLNAGLISNRLVATGNVTLSSPEGEIAFYANGIIRWKEQGSLSKNDYVTYIASNPLQIVYELATPLTYQLTPTQISALVGSNNVWVDTSAVITLIYRLLQVDRQTGSTAIGKNAESLLVSKQFGAYSKVVINVTAELYYESGNDTGRTLTISCPWGTQAMADNILASLQGYQYQPYEAQNALLDPAAELGDGLTVNGVYGGIFKQTLRSGALHAVDVSAPQDEEIDHEYKFTPAAERKIERRINNMESELSVQADQISAKVDRQGGDPSSVSWTMDSDVFKVQADGSDVLTIDENGLTVNGNGTFTGSVQAKNIAYGGSNGTFHGGGISGGSIGTSKFTSGINTSLGNADYAADIFAGAAIARWLKCNNVEIPAGQSLKIYNAKIKLSTMNVMLADGTTKYVYYCNWG